MRAGEGLDDARTQSGKRRVSARWGWSGEKGGLFQHPARGAVVMGEWNIEPATVESLPDILQIEEACFSTPWTRKMILAELSGNPFAHFLLTRQVPPGGVGSISIVGYLCFWVVDLFFFWLFSRKYG